MKAAQLAILGTGLVSAVGQSTAACGCAFRTGLSAPCETSFIDAAGGWIVAHQVDLAPPCAGLAKLAHMAAMAIEEALQLLERDQWPRLPLLLCVAETDRPGRTEGMDRLPQLIEQRLGLRFAPASALVPHGRVSVAVALAQAQALLAADADAPGVLVVGTDSLLAWPTLSHYERADRLLTQANSNGFMPGEGAGALWAGPASRDAPQLLCTGIGFGHEPAPLGSGEPLRADGLTQAIQSCLADAGQALHDMDLRIADLSGEHYYFKEAALALARTLRQGDRNLDLWHPAECTGEIGAAAGATVIAMAHEACRKGYAPGSRTLAHWANDCGRRAAVTLEYRG